MLVVFDDMDLPLGRIRLRFDGSDGGHRGMRSVIEHFGNAQVPRLKLGVGRPATGAIDHVLEKFSKDEREIVNRVCEDAVFHLKTFIEEPAERALHLINGKAYGES